MLSLATGVTIAAFSYYAKPAVRIMDPMLYNFGIYFGAVLIPRAINVPNEGTGAACARTLRYHKWESLVIGVGSPASYVLVLYALQLGPVS